MCYINKPTLSEGWMNEWFRETHKKYIFLKEMEADAESKELFTLSHQS